MKPTETPADTKSQAGGVFRLSENNETVKETIWRLVEPVCEAEGMELVLVELQRERSGRVLRLYIDKETGVTVDDCARISRQVDAVLDVYCDARNAYTLEVSSAGINRPLGRRRDFERFKGSIVRLKLRAPVDGRRNFKGRLLGLAGESVRLEIDNREFAVPYEGIAKAQLVNDDGVKGW
jgi:ribosome maturation factor RimP